jgi:hypothetical protein
MLAINMPILALPDYPFIIQLAALLSLIGFTIICVTMFVIYLNRLKGASAKKNKKIAEKIIYEEISDRFLVYNAINEIPPVELEFTVNKLSRLKNKSKLFSDTLIKTLVHFKLNLSGATVDMINSAYSWLGLKEFILKKLKSTLWFIRIEGLNEIQEMNDTSSLSDIRNMTKDRNIDVRVTAHAALIKLKTEDCFSFLEHESDQLSHWHQIFLFDSLNQVPDVQLPDFTVYLSTRNESMIIFCIKIIVHYKRFEVVPKMIELLNHKDKEVRNNVIWALGLLNTEEAEDQLKTIFPNEQIDNKSQILLALGNIASGNSLNFIITQFLKNDNHLLLKSAAEAITLHGTLLKYEIQNKLTNLSEEQKAMFKHFQEPLNLHGVH